MKPLVRLLARARRHVRRDRHRVSPWYVATTGDKRRAHLNIISHFLSKIPYKSVPREKIRLPERKERGKYRESDHPVPYIDDLLTVVPR